MSESYTIGLDSWTRAHILVKLGQVFTPKEAHTLNFIDLQMSMGLLFFIEPLHVHKCDATGQPIGDPITTSRSYTFQKTFIVVPQRVRFTMLPVLLEAEQRYIIVLHYIDISPIWTYWGRDYTDQTYYPRGWRMILYPGAPSWTPLYDECHIFAEWGDPPLPKPQPEPPIDKWAALGIEQVHDSEGVTITLATSVPCHLTCYWTDIHPLKHHRSRTIRGKTVPWYTYFCFVAWHAVEQEEPGDTLYHTFILKPWELCTTRWFTFRGEVDNVLSPSVGPIFEKHHALPPITDTFYPDPHPEVTSVDGEAYHYAWNQTWAEVHSAFGNTAWDTIASLYIELESDPNIDRWRRLNRNFLLFDTTPIPPAHKIISAKIRLYFTFKLNEFPASFALNIYQSNPASNTAIIPSDYQALHSYPLSSPLNYDDIILWAWHDFILNPPALPLITKGGISKFAVRESLHDVANSPPTWARSATLRIRYRSADGPLDWRPQLIVTHQPPE